MIDPKLRAELHPEFKKLVMDWVGLTAKAGLNFLVYCCERSAEEQAILYRRGRSSGAVGEAIARLESMGMPLMAEALREAPPQPGPGAAKIVTKALPGMSFHQPQYVDGAWGSLAFDSVPMLGGKAMWGSVEDYLRGGEIAESIGLTWSGRWGWERAHIQWDKGGELRMPALAIESDRAKREGL